MRTFIDLLTSLFLSLALSTGLMTVQIGTTNAQESNQTQEEIPTQNAEQPDKGYGGLRGSIRVVGDIASPEEITIPEDEKGCVPDGTKLFDQSLLVNQKQQLQGAFVIFYPRQEITPHPDLKNAPEDPVVFEMDKSSFVPVNAVVRAGQPILLVNNDPVGHNTNIQSFNYSPCVNLPPNSSLTITPRKGDKLPASVRCDIHPWMKGNLLISDSPYATVTDNDGSFLIEKIPVGKWKFQFWHNRCGYMKNLKRDGETFLGRRGEFEVEIKDGETVDLGELLIEAASLEKKD